MKLSLVQEKVYNQIIEIIELARSFKSYDEYFEGCERTHSQRVFRNLSADDFKTKHPEEYGRGQKIWEENKSGLVVTGCINSRTLYKLEQLGLIEIVENGKNNGAGIDVIRVLNY